MNPPYTFFKKKKIKSMEIGREEIEKGSPMKQDNQKC